MKIREKIKNRIKNRKGMSIGEVLVSVLIMLLATSVVTATVGLALNNYIRTLSNSEANVLASTLENLMTSELAYTTEIHWDGNKEATTGNVTKFQSQNYTTASSLTMFQVTDGKMMVSYPDNSDKSAIKLLGDGSYPNKLNVGMAKDKPFMTYNKLTHTFTISFSISRNGSTILERTFQVINVNNTDPE